MKDRLAIQVSKKMRIFIYSRRQCCRQDVFFEDRSLVANDAFRKKKSGVQVSSRVKFKKLYKLFVPVTVLSFFNPVRYGLIQADIPPRPDYANILNF